MRPQLDVLAALVADDPPVPPDAVRHQLLYRPTFHPETLLTVDLGDPSSVHLRVFTASVWTALTRPRGDRERDVPPTLPPHHDARAIIPPTRADALRRDLERHLVGLATRDDRVGRDGITLDVAVTTGTAAPRRLSSWSPDSDSPHNPYFHALYTLASDLLQTEPAQRRLDQLHGYFDLGLPVRDRGGFPRCVQIFGRLSSGDEDALKAFFAGLAPTEPIVVDMRNFEGMGTVLYPLFRRFARRPGPLAWAVSPAVRRQLRDAQVPASQLLNDLGDAILRVVARTPPA